jgi:hypothetical protein
VERSETFLQFAQDIFVHGITSSKIGWIFQGSIKQRFVQVNLRRRLRLCFPIDSDNTPQRPALAGSHGACLNLQGELQRHFLH